MKIGEAIQDLGRPVAYFPRLAEMIGVKECIFLSQLIYWTGKGSHDDGWIYKSQDEWLEETGMSNDAQRTARRNLKKLGLIAEKNKKLEHRIYYQADIDTLSELWDGNFAKQGTSTSGGREPPSRSIKPETTTDSLEDEQTPKPLSLGTKPPTPVPLAPSPPSIVQNCTTSQDRPDAPPPPPPAPAMESQPTPATAQPAYAKQRWNALAEMCGLKQIRGVAGSRLKHLRARVAADPEFWDTVSLMCHQLEPWAKGKGERKWSIDFDWIITSETNYCKLAEGKFGAGVAKSNTRGSIAATEKF